MFQNALAHVASSVPLQPGQQSGMLWGRGKRYPQKCLRYGKSSISEDHQVPDPFCRPLSFPQKVRIVTGNVSLELLRLQF
jgi:hypothetical protein